MLDRRDCNPFTDAEFPVPAILNLRMAASTLPALSTTEAQPAPQDAAAPRRSAGNAVDCGTHGQHGGAEPPRHLGGDERRGRRRRYQPG